MASIRKYHPKDKNDVVEVFKSNVPKYFSEKEVQLLINFLDDLKDDAFVVLKENQIVGFAGINRDLDKKEGVLSWGFIHPDFHQKGLGGLVTKHRISVLKEDKRLKTIIVRTSQLVFPFYEKMGFALIKTEKDYWDIGYDLYEMKMEI